MRNYVGLKIKGFEFDGECSIGFSPLMYDYIGKVGTITYQSERYIRIRFEDGCCWNYPIEEIHKHLIFKTMTYSELKILYDALSDCKDYVKCAIDSINYGYVSIEDFENDCYFRCGNTYYSQDEWVTTNEGDVISMEDAFYCEGIDEWVHYDDTVTAYEGNSSSRYSREYLRANCDYTYFNADYYDESALDRHDIVWCEDIEEYRHREDSWWDEEGEYYVSEEPEREEYVRGYHNGSYQSIDFTKKPKYRIGYEIEKEDESVRNSINISDFEHATNYKWRKERDGSLSDCSGYELISPTFELNIPKIFKHIEENEQLVAHINADISYSCGGHIHLSEKGLNGNELFNKVKGYTPLFYALYYGRVNKTYAKGKSNRDLENENEKYQAIKIHHDRIEFRIISAVPNVKTLKWRTKLLKSILDNPTDDVHQAYFNVDTKFTKLLKETYSDDKLKELKQRFINFTKEFENIDINN